MGKGYWCAECMGFVEVYDEQAEPKPALAYRFPKASEPETPEGITVEEAPPEPLGLPVGMMKCPVCSHLVSRDAFSCPACGHPLREVPKPTPEDTYAAMQEFTVRRFQRRLPVIIIVILAWFFVIRPLLDGAVDYYMRH